MHKNTYYIVLFLLSFIANSQSKDFTIQLDSIQELRHLSKNESLDIETRIHYGKQASELSYKTEVDSVILKSNNNFISVCLKGRKFNGLKKLCHKTLKLSKKLKDSVSIAANFSSLGRYYSSVFLGNISDSAFYYFHVAEKTYEFLKKDYKIAQVLFNKAKLQCYEKNYTSSEITSIKAISILKEIEQSEEVLKLQSFIYNNLGIIFHELEDYKESIKYHTLSLKIKRNFKGDFQYNIYNSLNNLGNTYRNLGRYNKAIEKYLEILKGNNVTKKYPSIYVMVLDNYAHTLFLSNNHKQLPDLYLRALKIADSIKDTYKTIIIHQHLAEFYNYKKQKDSALYHGYKAKDISEHFYKDDVLKSLLILSRIETDSIAVRHYEAYITLNDSIQQEERLKRNKHARIQFETNQHIKKAEQLSTQNILISITGGVLILIIGLLYFIKEQRSKNKELVLINEQEKANQEIYSLMLQQHEKEELGRLKERHRIAEELHDGVLSRLFGTRMGLGFLNIQGDNKTIKQYDAFMKEMQDVEGDIRNISHELKHDVLSSKTHFESMIEAHLKTQSAIGRFEYEIINKDNLTFERLNESVRVDVYRIIQEAIQNIIKHAKAKQVTIVFSKMSNMFQVTIKDDGVGFSTNKNHKGIGLQNMQSRASKIHGTLTVTSKVKSGTSIKLSIPVN